MSILLEVRLELAAVWLFSRRNFRDRSKPSLARRAMSSKYPAGSCCGRQCLKLALGAVPGRRFSLLSELLPLELQALDGRGKGEIIYKYYSMQLARS